MSNSNRNSQDQSKRDKGLAMMGMLSGMPDDLVLCGSPDTAPRPEKRENAFLRLMSSPVAAVILSLCVAFAVVIAIIRMGTGKPVDSTGANGPGHVAGKPGISETDGSHGEGDADTRTVTRDVDGIRFVIEGIKDAYTPNERIRFTVYTVNIGEPFTYTGYSFDFRPEVEIIGNGMEQGMGFGLNIDTDEKVKTHTVKTGQESSFKFPIDLYPAGLNGAGAYTVTLTYNGKKAVFADVFTVVDEPETTPPTVVGDPADWMDMHYTGDAYAYACPTGKAFCFRVGLECIPGDSTRKCFRTDYPSQVNAIEAWLVVDSKDELRNVLENYKNMGPDAPGYADMKKTVKMLETEYDAAFFQTHGILLLRFETTSGSARYTVTDVSVEEKAIDGSGRAVTLGGYDVNQGADGTTDMAGYVMLIPLDKGINIGGVYTMIKHPD